MKLLKCKLCQGEADIVGGEHAINKKIKCTKCGFTNESVQPKGPEIIVMRRRPKPDDTIE